MSKKFSRRTINPKQTKQTSLPVHESKYLGDIYRVINSLSPVWIGGGVQRNQETYPVRVCVSPLPRIRCLPWEATKLNDRKNPTACVTGVWHDKVLSLYIRPSSPSVKYEQDILKQNVKQQTFWTTTKTRWMAACNKSLQSCFLVDSLGVTGLICVIFVEICLIYTTIREVRMCKF